MIQLFVVNVYTKKNMFIMEQARWSWFKVTELYTVLNYIR